MDIPIHTQETNLVGLSKKQRKSANRPEKQKTGGEFLDIETLDSIANSEGEKAGAFLTVDNLKMLRQADEEQKDRLNKLQQDMTKITSQLGSLLSLGPLSPHQQVPVSTNVTPVIPVTCTTPAPESTTTTVSFGGTPAVASTTQPFGITPTIIPPLVTNWSTSPPASSTSTVSQNTGYMGLKQWAYKANCVS